MKRIILISVILVAMLLAGCADSSTTTPSIQVVAGAIGSNKLNITLSDLQEKPNPKGEGIFVYVPQTQFNGVERFVIWMVIDGQAYPLNGATKDVTPSLIWPREAPESVWQTTGISPYVATEAIEIVFGQ